MRKVAVLIILALLFQSAFGQANQATQEWIRFAPPNGGFVVMMPDKPKEDVDVKDSFTTHLFTVSVGQAVYLVGFGDYAPSVRLDPQKELEANRDNFNKGLNATLRTSTPYNIDGRMGLEFTSETNSANLKSRVFIVGNRVIQLATLVSKNSNEQRNIEKFLDSFAFTTKN
jgi:hypothetical protein